MSSSFFDFVFLLFRIIRKSQEFDGFFFSVITAVLFASDLVMKGLIGPQQKSIDL